MTDDWLREGHAEPHPDAVVKVVHHSLSRGKVTRYLEPGHLFHVANDDPSETRVEPLPDDHHE